MIDELPTPTIRMLMLAPRMARFIETFAQLLDWQQRCGGDLQADLQDAWTEALAILEAVREPEPWVAEAAAHEC
jgi:hypothetical protein